MSTKQVTTKLTDAETKFNGRVKSVELAIKSQGKNGIASKTLIEVAAKIYGYITS